jgi:2-polyprenyl-3-methyl-5-hydroxy-6-metoxy-1,4-benzoquinol methylase
MTAPVHSGLEAAYRDKPAGYFGNSRLDIVAMLATDADAAVLELGCGEGVTGQAALEGGKAGRYVGIELNQAAAAIAARRLSQVLVGDVGTLDLAGMEGQFDTLIVSEVLEHLVDPWGVLERLANCLKPGAAVYASSPNVSHYRVIAGLLVGRFDYAPAGVMDRTHLRWFTPSSYRRIFEEAGFDVDELGPLRRWSWRTRALRLLAGERLMHLHAEQIFLRGHRRA